MTDPAWLTDGTPVVVYFPRPDPAMAEAWPVISLRRTATTVVVRTELGEERFGRFDLRMLRARNDLHQPMLLPAHDPRAEAAAHRTAVMLAAHRLTQMIARHRPTRTTPTAQLLADVEMIRDAAEVAYDDIAELIARVPS